MLGIPAVVWQIATPFIGAMVTAVAKDLVQRYGGCIPAWLKPIIAAVSGSLLGVVTGDASMAQDAAVGFALGGGAPMVREVKERLMPAPEKCDKDFANG